MPKVPRVVLKDYFQTGDKPTQPQFSTMLDSMLNFIDDRDLIGLRVYNPDTEYAPGDFAVYNDQLLKCITGTTGTFNPADWEVLNSFGSVTYVSPWDTQNNEPELESSVGTKGFYYVVTNASSNPADNTELNGISDWGTGDWAIFNGTAWQKVANSAAPIPAINVTYEPSGDLESTNVQDALDELDAAKQATISIKPPSIPYAITQTRLAESWLANTPDGVTVSLKKVIRSEPNAKAQIDFGNSGSEVKLSTAGSAEAESRLLLSSKDATLLSDIIALKENTGKSFLLIKGGGNLSLVNDAGSGTDCTLKFEPGRLDLTRPGYGGLSVTAGSSLDGQTVLTGGDSSVVLTSGMLSVNSNGGSVTLDDIGNVEVSGETFIVNTIDFNVPLLSASTVAVVDASNNLVSSTVTSAELESLSGVTSGIQDQLDAKLDLAGGTMTGALTLSGDPAAALEAATMQYVDSGDADLQTQVDAKVNKTGDTMTGLLVLSADPTAALGAVTKQYADAIQTDLEAEIDAKVNKGGDTMTGLLVLSADPVGALGAVTKQYADAIQDDLEADIDTKVSKAGDTMSGLLVLSADPTAALGAVTKQYADAIQASLVEDIDAKVSKSGDTMTGALTLNGDPTGALVAAPKQYVDAATKKLFIPFAFNGDVVTSSSSYVSIPLQVVIPEASTVFPGTTTITAKLTIDYMTEDGSVPAQGEAGLTQWTTGSTPSLVSGSSVTMAATMDVWTKATNTSVFSIADNKTYRIIFKKTAGSASARIHIEAASLTLFYS